MSEVNLSDEMGSDRARRLDASHQLLVATTKAFSTRYGQLATIRSQLCQSVAEAATAEEMATAGARAEFADRHVERITELLKHARSCFHYLQVPTSQDPKAMLFDMDDDAFAVAARDAAPAKEEDLRRARDMVWSHDHRASEVWSGQQPESAQKSFLNPYIDEIRGIAADYCVGANLASTALEWALVDCLVHDSLVECAAQYRSAGLLKETIAGQRVSGPLLRGEFILDRSARDTPMSKFMLGLGTEWLGKAIGEAIAIAVSAGIAYAIAGSESSSTNAWIVFTGMTATRWVVRAIRNLKANAPTEAAMDFMWRACQAYEAIPGMNAGQIRHLLYGLAAEGALFHPEVFDVLDKRLRRLATA